MNADRLVLCPSGPFYESCPRCNGFPVGKGGLPFSRAILWDDDRDFERVHGYAGGILTQYGNRGAMALACDCEIGLWYSGRTGAARYDSWVGSDAGDTNHWNVYHHFERMMSEQALEARREAEPGEADQFLKMTIEFCLAEVAVRSFAHDLRLDLAERAVANKWYAEDLWNRVGELCSANIFDRFDVERESENCRRTLKYPHGGIWRPFALTGGK